MLASHLLDFIEITFTGVLVISLVHATSMLQHMLSVWFVQQYQGTLTAEKKASKRSRRKGAAVKTGTPVTGLLALVAERERHSFRAAVTNVGGR